VELFVDFSSKTGQLITLDLQYNKINLRHIELYADYSGTGSVHGQYFGLLTTLIQFFKHRLDNE